MTWVFLSPGGLDTQSTAFTPGSDRWGMGGGEGTGGGAGGGGGAGVWKDIRGQYYSVRWDSNPPPLDPVLAPLTTLPHALYNLLHCDQQQHIWVSLIPKEMTACRIDLDVFSSRDMPCRSNNNLCFRIDYLWL